jgi:hypothetical protein
MLKTLSNSEYLELLVWTRNAFDQALHRGDIAFAFGVERPPLYGKRLLLDGLAEMAVSLLSVSLGRKAAAQAIRENWEIVLRAVEKTEDDTRLFTKAGIPNNEQLFLVASAESDGSVLAQTGFAHDALTKLSVRSTLPGDIFFRNICGVAIQNILHQLRANARTAGIKLPPRFSVSRADPVAYERWQNEIEEYRRLSHRRFETKQAKAREKELA